MKYNNTLHIKGNNLTTLNMEWHGYSIQVKNNYQVTWHDCKNMVLIGYYIIM
jgi:hypothetical protein